MRQESGGELMAPAIDEESDRLLTDGSGFENPTCYDCGRSVQRDWSFCRNCGASDPADRQSREDGASTTVEYSDSDGTAVTSAAESLRQRLSPRSSTAQELLRVLSDTGSDESDVEEALENAVERLDATARVVDAISEVDETSERELKTAKRTLSQHDDAVSNAIESLLDGTLEQRSTAQQCERERDHLRRAVDTICQTAEDAGTVSFQSTADATKRASKLADSVDDGEIALVKSGVEIGSLVDTVERSARPETRQSHQLLEALRNPDATDAAEILTSTVETVDDAVELQAALGDIESRDVRRRLESLDRELRGENGDVYRHLADRIREFETILDRDDSIDDVRLYAIYQECTFYDRTLLPRLSRSLTPDQTTDVGQLRATVEDRIQTIENEYISVRADHNHTIPRHFLSLVKDVAENAQRVENDRPEHAIGLLTAADELLDGVEQLYERNEYSVMLRRLRG